MRRSRRVVLMLVLLMTAGLAYSAYGAYQTNPEIVQQVLVTAGLTTPVPQAEGVHASGTIEALPVQIMSQVPGRVLSVAVEEGEMVSEGQVLVRLDPSLLQKQLAVAAAEVQLAEARLALVRAGPRSEEIARAQAEVAAAQVALEVARQALEDAQALRDNPQDVAPEVVQAGMNLAHAQHLRDAALARAQAADLTLAMWGRVVKRLEAGVDVTLPGGIRQHFPSPRDRLDWAYHQWNQASQQVWQAWAQYRQAEAAVEAARVALETAQARAEDPGRDVAVAQAQAAYLEAQAGVKVARAGLAAVEEGVNPEKIATAEANLKRARAAYERLRAQERFYTLRAPISGRVTLRSIQPGEVAGPGVPLLEIADLSTLRLTLYVPEGDLGAVRLGQEVAVTVDAYPGRTFPGTVIRISDEAEFTPRNVQTPEERVVIMYAVEVYLPNPDGALKPGMPADGVIRTG